MSATCCLILAAAATLNLLLPHVQGPGGRDDRRVAWYFGSGQLGADARTVAQAIRFLMDVPAPTLPPTLPPTAPPSQLALDNVAPLNLIVATNSGTNLPTA